MSQDIDTQRAAYRNVTVERLLLCIIPYGRAWSWIDEHHPVVEIIRSNADKIPIDLEELQRFRSYVLLKNIYIDAIVDRLYKDVLQIVNPGCTSPKEVRFTIFIADGLFDCGDNKLRAHVEHNIIKYIKKNGDEFGIPLTDVVYNGIDYIIPKSWIPIIVNNFMGKNISHDESIGYVHCF